MEAERGVDMFIICGWGNKLKKVMYAGIHYCQNCHQFHHFHIIKVVSQFSVFWIPLFSRTKYYVISCEACKNMKQLNPQEVENMMKKYEGYPDETSMTQLFNYLNAHASAMVYNAENVEVLLQRAVSQFPKLVEQIGMSDLRVLVENLLNVVEYKRQKPVIKDVF